MKTLLILIIIGIPAMLSSQVHYIYLINEPVPIILNDFYINDIIDGRVCKDNLGIVKVGLFNKKVRADFDGGFEKALEDYIFNSFPRDTNLAPVTIKISNLTVSEKLTSKETGRANVSMIFYKHIKNNYYKLYETSAFIEYQSLDVTKKHDSMIRNVIFDCIQNFNDSEWKTYLTVNSEPLDINMVKQDSVSTEFTEIEKPSFKRNYLISYNKLLSLNSEGWAIKLSSYINSQNNKWLFPFSIAAEHFTLNQDYFNKSNYSKAEINYLSPGFNAMKKINEKLYLNLSFLFPVGNEKLIDRNGNNIENLIVGINPSQGLIYIPDSKFGITFGISFVEKVLSSAVYHSDFGLNLEIGLKF